MSQKYFEKLLENGRAVELKRRSEVGSVLYWVNRDIRLLDNPSFAFAQSLALESKRELCLFFGFDKSLLKYNQRQQSFLYESLLAFNDDLKSLDIPLYFRSGDIVANLRKLVSAFNIKSLVTDFSPLKQDRKILDQIVENFNLNIYQVDSHNIVPCRVASDKKEYAAYTIRPKINSLVEKYLESAPEIVTHPYNNVKESALEFESLKEALDRSITNNIIAGEKAAFEMLEKFISQKLKTYDSLRNNPTEDNQSNLSPYLHFGLISSHSVLMRVLQEDLKDSSADQFIEELVVRKELSDNFCHYAENYDTIDVFPDWAKKTLNEHSTDFREYLYSFEEFEKGEIHDPLWNAAQVEMVTTGKMHGYMRMYWAKKILEWTPNALVALDIALKLNDKYSIDGNDPNGYAGVAWSIGGVHDRAWFEREIFGKVRYMSYNGCKKKFDIETYIRKFSKSKQEELL